MRIGRVCVLDGNVADWLFDAADAAGRCLQRDGIAQEGTELMGKSNGRRRKVWMAAAAVAAVAGGMDPYYRVAGGVCGI